MRTPRQWLELALTGDATAAAELWKAIANGTADDQVTVAWARNVAVQVISKVLHPDIPANRQREKARDALGLEGRIDRNLELRILVEEIAPDATPAQLAAGADLVVDVRGASQEQVRRRIETIKRKGKKP